MLCPSRPVPTTMTSTWYCCGCQFGPHNGNMYDSCVNCGNKRCDQCTDEEAKKHLRDSSDSQCHHEISPWPSVVALDTARTASLADDLSPCLSEDEDLSQIRPSPRSMHTARPSRLGASQLGPKTGLYICCKCQDGPKVYKVQPICVVCTHDACPSCTYV